MISLWEGIDSETASQMLRGLNRRLSELEKAIEVQSTALSQSPESFSAQLSIKSLTSLQSRLQTEKVELVEHRKAERLIASLKGRQFQDHTASIGELGVFLIRLQKLYSSIAQAITTGPKKRGPISRDIINQTTLRFADAFPGSFGMEIFIKPQFDEIGESVAVTSLQTLFGLLASTSREKEFARLSGELGQRSMGHLRHVLDNLSRESSGIELCWSDPSGTQYTWCADKEEVPALRERIQQYSQRVYEERRFEGFLTGASLLRNRFEFFRLDKTVIEGKIARAARLKIRDVFGRRCIAVFDQIEITDRVTRDRKSFYTLIDILPGTANPPDTGSKK